MMGWFIWRERQASRRRIGAAKGCGRGPVRGAHPAPAGAYTALYYNMARYYDQWRVVRGVIRPDGPAEFARSNDG